VFELMTRAEVDMTLFFTHLAQVDIQQTDIESLKIAFYTDIGYANFQKEFVTWLNQYAQRVQGSTINANARLTKMQHHNPRYVLRNYMAQEAIDLAETGDNSRLLTLLTLLKNPYTMQAGMEQFEQKRPDWARQKAGCSMLSCSS
jgi:uncharacterized protein YdiU (UPF0061 family)